MNTFSLSHLPDAELLRRLAAHTQLESTSSDAMLAHFAEAEVRGLDTLHLPFPDRLAVAFTITRITHEKLRRAQDLLGDEFDPADVDTVIEKALEMLIGECRRRGRLSRASG